MTVCSVHGWGGCFWSHLLPELTKYCGWLQDSYCISKIANFLKILAVLRCVCLSWPVCLRHWFNVFFPWYLPLLNDLALDFRLWSAAALSPPAGPPCYRFVFATTAWYKPYAIALPKCLLHLCRNLCRCNFLNFSSDLQPVGEGNVSFLHNTLLKSFHYFYNHCWSFWFRWQFVSSFTGILSIQLPLRANGKNSPCQLLQQASSSEQSGPRRLPQQRPSTANMCMPLDHSLWGVGFWGQIWQQGFAVTAFWEWVTLVL